MAISFDVELFVACRRAFLLTRGFESDEGDKKSSADEMELSTAISLKVVIKMYLRNQFSFIYDFHDFTIHDYVYYFRMLAKFNDSKLSLLEV